MKKVLLFLSALIFLSCAREDILSDYQKNIKHLNNKAFNERLYDSKMSLHYADSALKLLYLDSVNLIKNNPDFYYDNVSRALNSMAYENFLLSDFEKANENINSLYKIDESYPNKNTEHLIAKIINAKMMMRLRVSWKADELLKIDKYSYKPNDTLYLWAKSQYYVTKLFLNCFYRDGKYQYNELVKTLNEIEQDNVNQKLMVDETQAYTLYYTLTESCQKLAHISDFYQNEEGKKVFYIKKSVDYLKKSILLMDENQRVSNYDLANNLQTLAGLINDINRNKDYSSIKNDLDDIMLIINCNSEKFGVNYTINIGIYDNELKMNLLRHADSLFYEIRNPYQIIASKSMIADFYIRDSMFIEARPYLLFAKNFMDSINKNEHDDMPPVYKFKNTTSKMAERVYLGLIKTRASNDPDELMKWFSLYQNESNKAFEKEKFDFNYLELRSVNNENKKKMTYMLLSIILIFIAFATIFVFFKYARRNNKLLKKQKQLDLERIANVETCLSIFRHDMSPYIMFLQRDNIPDEIKHDALQKLVATLNNTMRWINISTPNGLPFKKTSFVLNDAFDSVAKGITNPNNVNLIFKDAPCEVWGDKNLVEIMLRNLINNALRYTTKGYVKVSAKKYEKDNKFVKITVEDTGCGISKERLDELFRSDKLIENENSNSTGHHGFGLMLCAYIIKKHDDETRRGCKIWVESEVNKGTKIHFILCATI
ncbi:MAG: ATP-binding protein [Bacteroidales bacterium]|nr:ATP-binding protein [Bacteroidales bacterium]